MNDRILLAHAMNEGQDRDLVNIVMFDPFTDANDDYAVLEWMRNLHGTGERTWFDFIEALDEIQESPHNYKMGDYARACLKVLDNEQ